MTVWEMEVGNREQAIAKAAAAVGIPKFTTYQIRHSFGAALRQTGTDVADIQDMYGHMNAEMTKIYARAVIEKDQEAIGRLRSGGTKRSREPRSEETE